MLWIHERLLDQILLSRRAGLLPSSLPTCLTQLLLLLIVCCPLPPISSRLLPSFVRPVCGRAAIFGRGARTCGRTGSADTSLYRCGGDSGTIAALFFFFYCLFSAAQCRAPHRPQFSPLAICFSFFFGCNRRTVVADAKIFAHGASEFHVSVLQLHIRR